jgi:hypothetical protein
MPKNAGTRLTQNWDTVYMYLLVRIIVIIRGASNGETFRNIGSSYRYGYDGWFRLESTAIAQSAEELFQGHQ